MTGHLIDRPAKYQPCPRCGKTTLTAITGGMPVRLDPESLSINAEIAAILAKRITWDVYILGLPGRMYVEPRDIDRIRADRKRAVIASHTCTALLVRPEKVPGKDLIIPSPRPPETDVIPF
jgi:RNA polymerase subunit RPABC4/transcription elongation factor Spt4